MGDAGEVPTTGRRPTATSSPVGIRQGESESLAGWLQSQVGNQATLQMMQRAPDPTGEAGEHQNGAVAAEEPPDLGTALAVPALEHLRGVATRSAFLLSAYGERGGRVVDLHRSTLERSNSTYRNAYAEYAQRVREARSDAQFQQDVKKILLGIAIGTGVGLLAGPLVPASASACVKVLAEVAAETAEVGLALAVDRTGLTDVAGTDLEPGSLDPDVLESERWQHLSNLYRSVVEIQRHAAYLPLALGNIEYCLGQFRLLAAGAPTDMPRAELVDMASTVNRAGLDLEALNNELSAGLERLAVLETRTANRPRPREVDMEADIWIMWMASLLDSRSDILDLNAIEDRLHDINVLGPGSILGVDFGAWTFEDEELTALEAARRHAQAIRARYDEID